MELSPFNHVKMKINANKDVNIPTDRQHEMITNTIGFFLFLKYFCKSYGSCTCINSYRVTNLEGSYSFCRCKMKLINTERFDSVYVKLLRKIFFFGCVVLLYQETKSMAGPEVNSDYRQTHNHELTKDTASETARRIRKLTEKGK